MLRIKLNSQGFFSVDAGERIFCKNLDSPTSCTIVALETINDRRRMTHEIKKKS